MSVRCAHYVRRHFPPPSREKPAEGQVSIIHRWDEHKCHSFHPCLTRFNGHGDNSPKRRRLFWTRRDVQMHSRNPKNTQVCILGGGRSSLGGQGLCGADPPCSVTRWKRQITSVTEQLSRGTVKWKSQERARSKVKACLFFVICDFLTFSLRRGYQMSDADFAFLRASSQ